MDLTDPTRAITSTLDGPVLAVLARTGRPVTVGQIAAEVPRGSEIGVRRAVARLVEQGIVVATQMGRNTVHELNRDHLAAPVAEVMAGLWTTLWDRLRQEVGGWEIPPVYGCVFGSAARRDGGTGSDIDLLLVHPIRPGEMGPSDRRLLNMLKEMTIVASAKRPPADTAERWEHQLDQLRAKVERWTGNPVQVVDLAVPQWVRLADTDPGLAAQIERDAVPVAGEGLPAALMRAGR